MTPLAAQLSKQLTMPKGDQKPFWGANIEKLTITLNNAQFFEITAITNLLFDLIEKVQDNLDFVKKSSFLPSPLTWIELNTARVGRMAFVLSQIDEWIHFDLIWSERSSYIGKMNSDTLQVMLVKGKIALPQEFECETQQKTLYVLELNLALAHAALIAINSPGIIAHKKREPNKGLVRRINKKFGPGNFEVNGWTELQLKISKPQYIDDGEPHEDHITGKRALHFCRQHIRIRNNKLGYVTAHWRGDASIGVRQKSYTVKP